MMNSVKLYTRSVILIRWLLRRLIKDQLQTKSLETDSMCSEKVCFPFCMPESPNGVLWQSVKT